MPPLLGPHLAVAALIGVAGLAKLAEPRPAGGALRAAGLPSSPGAVRLLGGAEVGIAVAAVVTGSWPGALPLAAAYAGFAWFSWAAIRHGRALAGCGCFGRPDTPPTGLHVTLNLLAAGVAAGVAVWPVGPVGEALSGTVPEAVALLAGTAATVLLLYALLAELPRVRAASTSRPVALTGRRR